MSLSSYSDIKSAVSNWLNRSDLDTYIPDFVALCEDRIYRDLRIRCMETAFTDTIASGVISLPTNYLEMDHLYIDGSPIQALQRKSAEWIYQNYPYRTVTDKPLFFARDVETIIFGPYPDSGYTVIGNYFKRLPALSASNTTNWFTDNAPSILLWGSLLEAEPFLKNDERIALWQAKYQEIKENLTVENDRENFSGSPLRMTVSWS